MMNEHYIIHVGKGLQDQSEITSKGAADGRFRAAPVVVIDINCVRWPVTAIHVHGPSRHWQRLFTVGRGRMRKLAYEYGPPKQLTFEEARQYICDLVVRRGWYTQGWQNEHQFVDETMACNDMRAVIDSISFYGKWVW
jgi:hypothetical protein